MSGEDLGDNIFFLALQAQYPVYSPRIYFLEATISSSSIKMGYMCSTTCLAQKIHIFKELHRYYHILISKHY